MFIAIVLGIMLIAWYNKYEELRLFDSNEDGLKRVNKGVLSLVAVCWMYGMISNLSNPIGLLWRPGARLFPVTKVICTVIWLYLLWWFRRLRLKEIENELTLERWRNTSKGRLRWTVVICGVLGLGAVSMYDRLLCGLDYYYHMIGSIGEITVAGMFVMPFLAWIQGFRFYNQTLDRGVEESRSEKLDQVVREYLAAQCRMCLGGGLLTMLLGFGLHWVLFRSRQELVFLVQSGLVIALGIIVVRTTKLAWNLNRCSGC